MTPRELAALEGLELRTVQGWCKRGRLPAVKVTIEGTTAQVWDIYPDVWQAHRDALLAEKRGRKKGGSRAGYDSV